MSPDQPADSATAAVHRRVLVVDDDNLVGTSVARLLRKHCSVDVLTDAREVLARMENGETWDAILCDLMMPGISGMELHRLLAQRFPASARKMIFMTGGAYVDEAERFLSDPERHRIEKPFDREVVLAALAEVGAA
jgi:CheY-like chemotaxis protein